MKQPLKKLGQIRNQIAHDLGFTLSRSIVSELRGSFPSDRLQAIEPPAKRAVQHVDELCGLLPAARSVGQRVDSFDHALDALL